MGCLADTAPLVWTILYDLVLDGGVGGIVLHIPLEAFAQPDFLTQARQTFARLQTALRRSSCVLLALTPLYEPGHDLRTCYPADYVLFQCCPQSGLTTPVCPGNDKDVLPERGRDLR